MKSQHLTTTLSLVAALALGDGMVFAPANASAAEPLSADAQHDMLDKYCITCHNYTDYAGGVEFELFDPTDPVENASIAERMLKKLRVGMMPPAGKDRPDPATVSQFVDALETAIDSKEKPSLRVPKLHRLNRSEY